MEMAMLEIAERVGLATALGLVVGLERLRAGKEAGIRTFSLMALAGCLSQLAGQPLYGVLALALTGVVIAVTNVYAFVRGSEPELTTSAALTVMSFIGMLVGQGQVFAAVTSTIIVLLLLAWKDEMVVFSQHLTREEVHAAITLLLLGLVILPLLPARPVDPWQLVNLRRIWVMVVMISGIGFANYLLLRRYGARGIAYTGFLGGLVNSTATVAEMAGSVRREGGPPVDFAFPGVMLAKTAMYLRNGVILALFAPRALPAGLLPVGLMLLVSITLAIRGLRRVRVEPPRVQLQSPFALRAALEFGLYFLVLTVVGGMAQRMLGNTGFYAVSFLGGMVSSSTTTATAAILAAQGTISPSVAGLGVVLSSIGSAVALLPPVARAAHDTPLLRRAAAATALSTVAALVGLAANPWFLRLLSLIPWPGAAR